VSEAPSAAVPDQAAGPSFPRPASLQPRTAVLLVSSFLSVLLIALMFALPVPYVVLKPGPALNTLGEVGGKPLIEVQGRRTYPTSGALDLTTVSVFGGPGNRVSLAAAVRGWLDSTQAVVPVESVYPEGQTVAESRQENERAMVSSQEAATVAALKVLDIPVPTTLTVGGFADAAPAAKVLRVGDVILGVGGVRTPDLTVLRRELDRTEPGGDVRVLVRRGGAELTVTATTIEGREGETRLTLLGVSIDPSFQFPFTVRIQIEDIGGPSAGTMFALGIIDKLTPGDLTGGRKIAGTGTIDADGVVGPIGGIQQKLVGARAAGATYFLAPAGECDEVVDHVPDGLTVVPVATLDEARTAVEAIARGGPEAAALPGC
jgi:PDZ domain-containing protein